MMLNMTTWRWDKNRLADENFSLKVCDRLLAGAMLDRHAYHQRDSEKGVAVSVVALGRPAVLGAFCGCLLDGDKVGDRRDKFCRGFAGSGIFESLMECTHVVLVDVDLVEFWNAILEVVLRARIP